MLAACLHFAGLGETCNSGLYLIMRYILGSLSTVIDTPFIFARKTLTSIRIPIRSISTDVQACNVRGPRQTKEHFHPANPTLCSTIFD